MKVRTFEEFYDSLSKELAWRRKELVTIKSLVEARQASSSKQKVLLRCGVTMLYAHWEGFIKNTAIAYMEFVSKKRIPNNKLKENFIAINVRARLDKAREVQFEKYLDVVNFLRNESSQLSSIPYKNAINTRSNLSADVLKEIVCILNLDYGFFSTKEVILNKKLLENRNSIAHGDYVNIDVKSYMELHTEVVDMIENFFTQLSNAAFTNAFSRK